MEAAGDIGGGDKRKDFLVHPDRINAEALSEIALIVLAVKIDNTLVPSTPEEIHQTIQGLVSLMERGTGNPEGTLNFLKIL